MARRLTSMQTACWKYMGVLNNNGYGPHRQAYERWVGPVGEGLDLDHLCRNRWCVNPDHLQPVSRSENHLRKLGGFCHRGHPRNEENTYKFRDADYCRPCRMAYARQYRAKLRAAKEAA